MEPSELLKMLGDFAKVMDGYGHDAYTAAYQSVLVSAWRGIFISGFSSLVFFLLGCLGIRLRGHWKDSRDADGVEWFMVVVGFGAFLLMLLVLSSYVADLYRLDYLTLEALTTLVK